MARAALPPLLLLLLGFPAACGSARPTHLDGKAMGTFYSVDYDDVTGANLDMGPEKTEAQRVKRAAEAATRREERTKERAMERLQKMRTKGSRVAVRYDLEGSNRHQWWNGVVLEHREVSGDDSNMTTEQILVKYVVDELSNARGMIEEMSEWVDLDTYVRLVT